jgi:hypothetical protein
MMVTIPMVVSSLTLYKKSKGREDKCTSEGVVSCGRRRRRTIPPFFFLVNIEYRCWGSLFGLNPPPEEV